MVLKFSCLRPKRSVHRLSSVIKDDVNNDSCSLWGRDGKGAGFAGR